MIDEMLTLARDNQGKDGAANVQQCASPVSVRFQPAANVLRPRQAAGVDEFAVDHHARRRDDAVGDDRRVIGHFLDRHGNAERARFGFDHLGGRDTATASGTKHLHLFHRPTFLHRIALNR